MNKTAPLRGVALRGAAFGVLAAAISHPALAADASNGERLGMRWCAACHVVSNDQREANTDAPPFEEIAKRFSEPGSYDLSSRPPRENARYESDTLRGR
jgi:cytochrome c2